MSDFETFKAQSKRGETAEPPDGIHTATLIAAKVGESRAGDTLVILEWQTVDLAHYWTSFHRVDGKAAFFTKQVLEGLGLNLDALDSWGAVGDALEPLSGATYSVQITRNGEYLNTTIAGKQTDLPVDAPATPKPASVFDDVPF